MEGAGSGGDDSGFGYEDPIQLLEQMGMGMGGGGGGDNFGFQNPDESDEGISMVNQGGGVPQFIQVPVHEGGGMIIPPHIQLQLAQQQLQGLGQGQFQIQGEDGGIVIQVQDQDPQGVGLGVAVEEEEVPLVGDDNNNDRPDDVNNNTTDPNLRQQQEQQQQLLLQQQQLQLHQLAQEQEQLNLANLNQGQEQGQEEEEEEVKEVIPILEEDSNSVSGPGDVVLITNGGGGDKKDKRKKKKKKKKYHFFPEIVKKEEESEKNENEKPPQEEEKVEIEYVPERLELSVFDPLYRAFANVFENFRISDPRSKVEAGPDPTLNLKKVPKLDLEEDLEPEKKDEDKPKLSKRKLKKLTRLSVAELKQVVPRPDVVEMHDVTAKDPKLLVHLKAYRNTVPVPRHWCYKRKYLQGKRGIEKPPFDLPVFIKKTGIMEMRAALAEKEDQKSLKAKMRERVRPKMGKIDIDYQKLHDAFFKWQTKPKMTIHGDLYYEGKEFETRMKDKKPGDLSDDLRTALGMPIGPNANRVPPPWLIAMQRYGPPPSYPHLKIPGLNAPIPEGTSFGYHAGGWGKPPVDEFGRPLYGDVFGQTGGEGAFGEEEYIDKSLWGELESEEEEESSEEEEEEEEGKEDEEGGEGEEAKGQDDTSGLQTPAEGLATPSGFSSIPGGLETPDSIELRKRRIEADMEGGDTPALFTVLPEKRVDKISGAMMASTHIYDITLAKEKSKTTQSHLKDSSAVELALDPSELDLVEGAGHSLAARYEQTLREKQASSHGGEDLSDMVAEHTAKQKNKRKRQMEQQDASKAKKKKEFKF